MAEVELQDLPEAKPRYVTYTQWLRDNYGLEIDARQAQVAVTRYHDFQRSDLNQSERRARLEASQKAAEERAAAAVARLEEAAQRRKDAEEARAAKAKEREEARAAKEAEAASKSAAEASGKKGRKPKPAAEEATDTEASETTTGNLEFASEGSKRSEGEPETAEF